MTDNPLNKIELLKNAFPKLSDADIETLSQIAYTRTYAPRVDLCREGEIGKVLFILASGEVDVIISSVDQGEIVIDTLHPGYYFGEMAFFSESKRMATVRAKTACETLEMHYDHFMPIANRSPGLLGMLIGQIIGHFRRNDRAVISQLHNKNVALQQAYADLAEQDELRSQFIATLSHELRTPLTSIQGFLGLMNQGAIKGDSLKVAMNSITRNVEKLVGLTNNLLILYEMYPGAPEYDYLNVADLLVEVLNVVKEGAEGKLSPVTLDIPDQIPQVYADKRGLVLALRALMENAFKFNPKQLPVAVRVYPRNETTLAIEIHDQGIGIPSSEQKRIFEPFYRLEKEGSTYLFPGLGIGLTIAQFMVDRHNGRIEVVSTPGEGSTFTILLPTQ